MSPPLGWSLRAAVRTGALAAWKTSERSCAFFFCSGRLAGAGRGVCASATASWGGGGAFLPSSWEETTSACVARPSATPTATARIVCFRIARPLGYTALGRMGDGGERANPMPGRHNAGGLERERRCGLHCTGRAAGGAVAFRRTEMPEALTWIRQSPGAALGLSLLALLLLLNFLAYRHAYAITHFARSSGPVSPLRRALLLLRGVVH